jgi:threonine/homoserine/homoserine lactone efflux protein
MWIDGECYIGLQKASWCDCILLDSNHPDSKWHVYVGYAVMIWLAFYLYSLFVLKRTNVAAYNKSIEKLHTIIGAIFFIGWVFPWLAGLIFGNKDKK